MSGNSAAGQQKTLSGQNMNAVSTTSASAPVSATAGGLGYGNNGTPSTPAASSNVTGGGGPTLSKNNSFKAAANSDSSAAVGGANGGFNQKTSDMQQNIHLTDDMAPDIPHDFAGNAFFSNDLDDIMGYGWKA